MAQAAAVPRTSQTQYTSLLPIPGSVSAGEARKPLAECTCRQEAS